MSTTPSRPDAALRFAPIFSRVPIRLRVRAGILGDAGVSGGSGDQAQAIVIDGIAGATWVHA